LTPRRRAFAAVSVAFVVTFVHLAFEFATWAVWDAAPAPGKPYPHPMPGLWPIISFPAFPLYSLLTGGDRDMFHTFEWVMIGNSVVWGGAACVAFLALTKSRARSLEGAPKRTT
jgi:hypothetical protein